MATMTPEQEARYALNYGLPRENLPAAAQAEYDRLRQDWLRELRERPGPAAFQPAPMAGEDGLGPAGAADTRVSPDCGFYADPGGQTGVRYWDGQEWSPLLPADLAGGRQVGKFPGPVHSPLPEPDGSWQFAAAQARRLRPRSAGFAVAAGFALAAGLVMHQWWLLYGAALCALSALRAWKARKDFLRLDQAARGAPVAVPDAASRARRAGIVFAVSLLGTAAFVAATVVLYARDLSKPHADFTLAALGLGASCCGLLYTFTAWQRFKPKAAKSRAVLAWIGAGLLNLVALFFGIGFVVAYITQGSPAQLGQDYIPLWACLFMAIICGSVPAVTVVFAARRFRGRVRQRRAAASDSRELLTDRLDLTPIAQAARLPVVKTWLAGPRLATKHRRERRRTHQPRRRRSGWLRRRTAYRAREPRSRPARAAWPACRRGAEPQR